MRSYGDPPQFGDAAAQDSLAPYGVNDIKKSLYKEFFMSLDSAIPSGGSKP
jgi:hypothetical protein